MALEQGQTYRSVDWNWESRNKLSHLWSIDFSTRVPVQSRGERIVFSKCAGTTASQCAEYWGRTLASQHLRPRPARAKRKTQRVIGVNPHRLGLGHDFLHMTTKGGATKEKKDKLKASVLQRILSRKWEDSSRCGSVAEPPHAPRGHQFGARLGRCPGSGLSPQ